SVGRESRRQSKWPAKGSEGPKGPKGSEGSGGPTKRPARWRIRQPARRRWIGLLQGTFHRDAARLTVVRRLAFEWLAFGGLANRRRHDSLQADGSAPACLLAPYRLARSQKTAPASTQTLLAALRTRKPEPYVSLCNVVTVML